jgi:hypothetical protein
MVPASIFCEVKTPRPMFSVPAINKKGRIITNPI